MASSKSNLIVGIALVVGFIIFAVGLILYLLFRYKPGDKTKNYKIPGIVLMVIGGIIIIVGVVLGIYYSNSSSKVTIVPVGGPGAIGSVTIDPYASSGSLAIPGITDSGPAVGDRPFE